MRISNSVDTSAVKAPEVEKKSGTGAARQGSVTGSDQVTVSEKAKEIGRLTAEVGKLPDVRGEKVNEVKSAVQTGSYSVKGEAVAEKIIKEAILDSIV